MSLIAAYLTVERAASELGMIEDGVRDLMRRGELRTVKRSKHKVLIPRPAFEAYRHKLAGTVPAPLGLSEPVGDLQARLAVYERRLALRLVSG